MELKKIAILGAGAIGGYILWGLSEKEGLDLCVVAEGSRKEKLEKNGLIIHGKKICPKVLTPQEARGADLLIVALKYNALRDSLDAINTIADQHTVVMSLMNGVDSEEIIGRVIGDEKVLPSFIVVSSERKENEIKFDPDNTVGVIFGEKDADRGPERVDAAINLFTGSGVHFRSSKNILTKIWEKYLRNIGNNLIQAVVGCGLGGYDNSEHMNYLKTRLEQEVIQVAEAKGITLQMPGETLTKAGLVKPEARFSTLQDLDAKRHTEIEMFSGTIVRMGRELGIPTPYNEYTYHIIKAFQEKNDGRLDF